MQGTIGALIIIFSVASTLRFEGRNPAKDEAKNTHVGGVKLKLSAQFFFFLAIGIGIMLAPL